MNGTGTIEDGSVVDRRPIVTCRLILLIVRLVVLLRLIVLKVLGNWKCFPHWKIIWLPHFLRILVNCVGLWVDRFVLCILVLHLHLSVLLVCPKEVSGIWYGNHCFIFIGQNARYVINFIEYNWIILLKI